jgi:hydroxyethylthiazole kinase-like uncharacterized protein yjeF
VAANRRRATRRRHRVAVRSRRWPLPVEPDGDKYSRGTVLVVGGSPDTPGAVVLCGLAALRMGAGRLQIATAGSIAPLVASAVVESRTFGVTTSEAGALTGRPNDALAKAIARADALVVGPGLLGDDGSASFITGVLDCVGEHTLVVLDALAVTTFGDLPAELRSRLRDRVLMTPNKQEAAALVVGSSSEHDDVLRRAARATGAVLSSFGIVQCPKGECWSTTSNPPGLGTSGSGDVLAGLVSGAASRCGDRVRAACWATYAHIEAGRRLGQTVGELGYLARDLLGEIPQCLPR